MTSEEKQTLRSMLFLDASNYFIPARKRGLKIDPFLLVNILSEGRNIVQKHFFSAEDENNKGQKKFHWKLREKGFIVHTVPLLFREKGIKCHGCGKISKCTCKNCGAEIAYPPHQSKEIDIEIAKTILITANNYDEVVIVSGDRDFIPVVKHLREQLSKTVVIVSYKENLSYLYRQGADEVITLDSLEDRVSYPYSTSK